MHCKINGGRLNFYEGKGEGEGKLISKIKCIHKAQKMIKDYIISSSIFYIRTIKI